MKKYLVIICVLIMLLSLCGCMLKDNPNQNEDPFDIMGADPFGIRNEGGFNVFVSKKVARKTCPDGWVFTFVHNIDKTGDDSDIVKYQFYGINIRYRFDPCFTKEVTREMDDGTKVIERFTPAVMIWGNGSEAQRHDMILIGELLNNQKTPEELLALNPGDYHFEELDKNIFFELLREAISGPAQTEGTTLSYWEKPVYAFLSEQMYRDGYKFQVSFLQETGGVDELFIDVLYRTGEKYDDYIQLSDLVQSGEASLEQVELFDLISLITQNVKKENNFLANTDMYREKAISGVELARLFDIMNNIHNNNFTPYNEEPIVETIKGNE